MLWSHARERRRRRWPERQATPAASSCVRRTRPWRGRAPPRAARGARTPAQSSLSSALLLGLVDFLLDPGFVDRLAVARERPVPSRNRLVVAAELEQQLPIMVLNDR